MVTAIVLINTLINTHRGSINDVAEALVDMDGVAEVYSVGGRYDLVTNQMLKLTNIAHTETLIAFKAYPHHDLERMFAIGSDTD